MLSSLQLKDLIRKIDPALMLPPIALIVLALSLSICSLYVLAKRVHRVLFGLLGTVSESPLRLTLRQKQFSRTGDRKTRDVSLSCDPVTGSDVVLHDDAPFDPNRPGRK